MNSRNARMRKPAVILAAGAVAAAAAGIFLGWVAAIPLLAVVLFGAGFNYWLSGRDSDAGALAGARADERQADIRMEQQAVAGVAMFAAAVAGTVISLLAKSLAWPFELVAGVGVVCYAAGLVAYGGTRRGRARDLRAMFGPGADERQAGIKLKAARLAGLVMLAAALIGTFTLSHQGHHDWLFSLQVVVFVAAGFGDLLVHRPRSQVR